MRKEFPPELKRYYGTVDKRRIEYTHRTRDKVHNTLLLDIFGEDGEWYCDHLWITKDTSIYDLGDIISFRGRGYIYKRRHSGTYDYGLEGITSTHLVEDLEFYNNWKRKIYVFS